MQWSKTCVSSVRDNIILETPVTFLNGEEETKGILIRKEGPIASFLLMTSLSLQKISKNWQVSPRMSQCVQQDHRTQDQCAEINCIFLHMIRSGDRYKSTVPHKVSKGAKFLGVDQQHGGLLF